MIKSLKYCIGSGHNPYENLAQEEYLLEHVQEGECILYLWQNEKTVVIGRNQNPWKECRVSELTAEEGRLVRRLSGGGAVFHDLGNLNFTFLVRKEDYDLVKQMKVIVEAVRALGIPAEITGRNDITADGKKFSGNAYYTDGIHSYHHGTILVNVDKEKLSRYLNVSNDKLITKGVDSVKARVVNLTEFKEEVTISLVRRKLIQAFKEVYGLPADCCKKEDFSDTELSELTEKFSSWEWNLGGRLTFNYQVGKRYPWGCIDLEFQVDKGIITECRAYSDAMEIEIFKEIPKVLTGCQFRSKSMEERLRELSSKGHTEKTILSDVISMLLEEQI